MATVFRLLNITWCPGTLEQNHVLGTMEGEANAPGSEGRQQHVGRSVLKTINGRLTIRRFLPPGKQGSADLGVKQLQRVHKRTENDDGLMAPAQFLHKVTQRWQFELRGNPAPGRKHSETFSV